VKEQGWIEVPEIISVPPPENAQQFDDSDFSPEAIQAREDEGYAATKKALTEAAVRGPDAAPSSSPSPVRDAEASSRDG
jgi:hypothetical protein